MAGNPTAFQELLLLWLRDSPGGCILQPIINPLFSLPSPAHRRPQCDRLGKRTMGLTRSGTIRPCTKPQAHDPGLDRRLPQVRAESPFSLSSATTLHTQIPPRDPTHSFPPCDPKLCSPSSPERQDPPGASQVPPVLCHPETGLWAAWWAQTRAGRGIYLPWEEILKAVAEFNPGTPYSAGPCVSLLQVTRAGRSRRGSNVWITNPAAMTFEPWAASPSPWVGPEKQGSSEEPQRDSLYRGQGGRLPLKTLMACNSGQWDRGG